MEWQKVYSKLGVHHKWIGLSIEAKGLWIDALLWCGLDEGGGFIPDAVARVKGSADLIVELVDAELWDDVEGGYQMHDYDIAQPDVEKRREQERSRQQRLRESRVTTRQVRKTDKNRKEEKREDQKRVEENSPNGESSSRDDITAGFTEIWNQWCDPLPKLRKPPSGKAHETLIARTWGNADGDRDVLAAAIRVCAKDEHYRQNRYGWASFCRNDGRWLGASETPPAPVLKISRTTAFLDRLEQSARGHLAEMGASSSPLLGSGQ